MENCALWYDNKPVLMMSVVYGTQPEDTCQRWDKKLKQYVAVSRPSIVREYNLKMGGFDLADRMISYYRMNTRTKKWTMRMLMHVTDLALANSWLLYRKDLTICGSPKNSIMQFLEFRMEVARTLFAQHHSQEDDADLSELSEQEDDSKQVKKTSSGGSAPCLSPQEGKCTSPRDDQPEECSTLQSTRLHWKKPNASCDLHGVLVLTS
ncbi:Chimeric ERCC6-PGBD3 protein Chimeric CSB-PGBD3 protein [Channa argus]|uniref:Chimeric ERCC6-PGBD3 protein Chimeric CSB-PGBD3 protein n=1 Tax=Channa argus TaxID=215402 RepID=A0A6G1QIS2_CHAAH|nr:Chimeric ERCC6-PGBD3 protein Chimeric CSB-PGBD3 protein [Channa argus]